MGTWDAGVTATGTDTDDTESGSGRSAAGLGSGALTVPCCTTGTEAADWASDADRSGAASGMEVGRSDAGIREAADCVGSPWPDEGSGIAVGAS
ncbi:hypothetical protein LV75_003830 [Actinokineospora diospyrosa]|uniref:Uncharacterized protein n=1 Tax=Actinokineospora diospyrosa TaxID=103728 RepID=A0ABT1IF94_9PSEU|nr:hypothetical protein [Actinokineospora diospyrosa]